MAVRVSEEDRLRIIAWAASHPAILKVYLFGSRARGEPRADSDIDLAVQMTGEDPFTEWFGLKCDFDEASDLVLEHRVDLQWYEPNAELDIVGPAVEREGILLYCAAAKYRPDGG